MLSKVKRLSGGQPAPADGPRPDELGDAPVPSQPGGALAEEGHSRHRPRRHPSNVHQGAPQAFVVGQMYCCRSLDGYDGTTPLWYGCLPTPVPDLQHSTASPLPRPTPSAPLHRLPRLHFVPFATVGGWRVQLLSHAGGGGGGYLAFNLHLLLTAPHHTPRQVEGQPKPTSGPKRGLGSQRTAGPTLDGPPEAAGGVTLADLQPFDAEERHTDIH